MIDRYFDKGKRRTGWSTRTEERDDYDRTTLSVIIRSFQWTTVNTHKDERRPIRTLFIWSELGYKTEYSPSAPCLHPNSSSGRTAVFVSWKTDRIQRLHKSARISPALVRHERHNPVDRSACCTECATEAARWAISIQLDRGNDRFVDSIPVP